MARRTAAQPAFALASILTAGVAIAATTTVYSVIDAVLLRPLPYANSSALQRVSLTRRGGGDTFNVPATVFVHWRDYARSLAALEGYQLRGSTMSTARGAEMVPVTAVSGGLLDMLGAVPLLGRSLRKEDAVAGRGDVAVIGEAMWRARCGADPAIVGSSVRLDDRSYQVVGVLRGDFRFPFRRDEIWVPLILSPIAGPQPTAVQVIARCRPMATRSDAERELLSLMSGEVSTSDPSASSDTRVRIRRFRQQYDDAVVRRGLEIAFAAVVVILLLALLNAANLLAIRAESREQEIAVRSALGASLLEQMSGTVLEGIVVIAAGGAVGIVGSVWLLRAFLDAVPVDVRGLNVNDIAINWRVLLFALLVTCGSGLVLVAVPVVRAAGRRERIVPRAAVRSSRERRWRFRTIVIVELAFTVVLVLTACVLAGTFAGLMRMDPGFETEHLAAAEVLIPQSRFGSPSAQQRMLEDVLQRLRKTSGVVGAAIGSGIPPDGAFAYAPHLVSDVGVTVDDPPVVLAISDVGPGFFEVLGVPQLSGRPFTREDATGGADVTVISEDLALRLWPRGGAVGRRFRVEESWYTVVGVVGNVFQLDYAEPKAVVSMYVPTLQRPEMSRTILVRTRRLPASQLGVLSRAIWAVEPDLAIMQIATASDLYSSFLAAPRFYAELMTLFGVMATVLSMIGLYGVMTTMTNARTREFAIRYALGAKRRHIIGLVLTSGVALVGPGAIVGVAFSVAAGRTLEAVVAWVKTVDASTYVWTTGFVVLVALMACLVPAYRVSAVEPSPVLRQE